LAAVFKLCQLGIECLEIEQAQLGTLVSLDRAHPPRPP
jgi:hypothetical protein